MKHGKVIVLIIGILLAGSAIFMIVSLSADKYLSNKTRQKSCPSNGTNHKIVIQDNAVNPAQTTAPRCDTLTIQNTDNTTRLIGFGEHDQHQAYDGVSQRLLASGESFTITLNEIGTFGFHDHYQDEVEGSFTVN